MKHILTFSLIFCIVFSLCSFTSAVEELRLWDEDAPNALGKEAKDVPKLLLYSAPQENRTTTAVLVCPGGGYGGLAMDHEGDQIGKWFQSIGVSAFILDYRHRGKGYGHPNPKLDAQRALRTIRFNAEKWNIDPQKIGIMGFSAGGHLASTVGTHFELDDKISREKPDADAIDKISSRPDFMILCYPVIQFNAQSTHRGTQKNLLGEDAPQELIDSYSNEKRITAQTPRTFLLQTDEDTVVPAENAVSFYLALRKHKVPAELHVYQKGPHGIGLAKKMPGNESWPELCRIWIFQEKK